MKKTNFLIASLFASIFLVQMTFAQTIELWGTSINGGSDDKGVVYKVNSDGTGFKLVHNFSGSEEDGEEPVSQLIQVGCKMYGVTEKGGAVPTALNSSVNSGVLFSIDLSDTNYIFKKEYDFANGFVEEERTLTNNWTYQMEIWPTREILAYNNKIYGVDGSAGWGQIFEFNPVTGVYTPLRDLHWDSDNNDEVDLPQRFPGGIIIDENGVMYGHSYYGGTNNNGTIWKYDIDNDTYEIIGDLGDVDAKQPIGKMLKASNGDLYINCARSSVDGGVKWGKVIAYTDNELVDVLQFQGDDEASDLGGLSAGSFQEVFGKVYGFTRWFGDNNNGVVFSVDVTTGDKVAEHSLNGAVANGYINGLYLGSNFNLYTVSHGNGVKDVDDVYNYGHVVEYVAGSQAETAVHGFLPDGSQGRNSIHAILNEKDKTLDYETLCAVSSNDLSADLKGLVKIYPNPTNGNVNLEIGVAYNELNITVTNLVGKTILTAQNTAFDLSNVPAGAYFLTIEVDNKITVEKLIVE